MWLYGGRQCPKPFLLISALYWRNYALIVLRYGFIPLMFVSFHLMLRIISFMGAGTLIGACELSAFTNNCLRHF